MGTRRRYSREFKVEAVRLVVERRVAMAQAARDLDVHVNVLRSWVRAYRIDPTQAFPGVGQQAPDAAEVTQLRREVARLKMERDILKNDHARLAPPVAPETRSGYCLVPERRGRLLIGVIRARQKTWSGGGLRT